MKDRIQELISKLEVYREEVLSNYLAALDLYDPKHGSLQAVDKAGVLHDLDRHLGNLHQEANRETALEIMGGVIDA